MAAARPTVPPHPAPLADRAAGLARLQANAFGEGATHAVELYQCPGSPRLHARAPALGMMGNLSAALGGYPALGGRPRLHSPQTPQRGQASPDRTLAGDPVRLPTQDPPPLALAPQPIAPPHMEHRLVLLPRPLAPSPPPGRTTAALQSADTLRARALQPTVIGRPGATDHQQSGSLTTPLGTSCLKRFQLFQTGLCFSPASVLDTPTTVRFASQAFDLHRVVLL